MKPRETADIRVSNLQAVLEALQRADGATRTGLAAATGLSLMSISNLVDQLSRSGLVRVEAQAEPVARKGAGRRAEILRVEGGRMLWLVLDLTDTFFRWAAIRLDRRMERSGTPWRYEADKPFAENLRAFLARSKEELREEWPRIGGIAVVAPGPYDPATDTIVNTRIVEMNDLRLKAFVAEELGEAPMFVDEDVKFAARAYGEMAGSEESLYYLYAGEGVGGALVYQGSVFHSLNSVAGDPSLLEILGCGPYGERATLRAFAARLGLDTAEKSGSALLASLVETARTAPERYEQALTEAAEDVVRLLRVAQAMLDPHAVVVDCLWARPMSGRFITMLSEKLGPVLPLRKVPRLVEPVLPLHAPWYGAVKALERDMIRRLKTLQ